jgi:hypothetical protein
MTPLREPVVVSQFWKNRAGDALRIELRPIGEANVVDVRVWRAGSDGIMRPLPDKGVAVIVTKLPELVCGLVAAERRARELGLLS